MVFSQICLFFFYSSTHRLVTDITDNLKKKLRQIPIWGFYTHLKKQHNEYWKFILILLFSKFLSNHHTYTHFKILKAPFQTLSTLLLIITLHHFHFINQKDFWFSTCMCSFVHTHTNIYAGQYLWDSCSPFIFSTFDSMSSTLNVFLWRKSRKNSFA